MISYTSLTSILTLVTALGCGTIAGGIFAFSAFVMKALARLPAADGIAAKCPDNFRNNMDRLRTILREKKRLNVSDQHSFIRRFVGRS